MTRLAKVVRSQSYHSPYICIRRWILGSEGWGALWSRWDRSAKTSDESNARNAQLTCSRRIRLRDCKEEEEDNDQWLSHLLGRIFHDTTRSERVEMETMLEKAGRRWGGWRWGSEAKNGLTLSWWPISERSLTYDPLAIERKYKLNNQVHGRAAV